MNRSFKIAGVCILVLCLALLWWFWSRGGDSDALIFASKKGSFSGVVVNGLNDLPIADALLEVKNLENASVYARDKSNERGLFSIPLADGNYAIEASSPGFTRRGKSDIGRQIAVVSGTRFVNAKVKLWPPARITGRVSDGQRGLSAKIELAYEYDASGAEDYVYQSISSADDGHFVIPNAYAGLGIVSVSAPGFASVTLGNIDLQFGANVDLGDIPLREGVSVYGVIDDAMTGKPVSGATISLRAGTESKALETRSLHSGQYRFGAISADRAEITVKAVGYRDFQQSLSLQSSLNFSFDVALERAWGLSLEVRNETDRPPLRTQVIITDKTSEEVVYEQWVDNGPLLLDSLKGGPFEIFAQSYDKRAKVVYEAELGQKIDVVLKAGAQLRVKAYGPNGQAVKNASYSYYYRKNRGEEAQISPWFSFDAPGFELTDLDTGMYQFQLRSDNGEAKSDEINLQPGDVRELNISCHAAGDAAMAPPVLDLEQSDTNVFEGTASEADEQGIDKPEMNEPEMNEPEMNEPEMNEPEMMNRELEQGVEPDEIYEDRFEYEKNYRERPESYAPLGFQSETQVDDFAQSYELAQAMQEAMPLGMSSPHDRGRESQNQLRARKC